MYRELVVTECTSSMLIAALHDVSLPGVESVFAGRRPTESDQILVAWQRGDPIGYIASTSPAVGEIELWEHGVVPKLRQHGVGAVLLRELALRSDPGSIIVVDPAGQLDPARMKDYYGRRGFDHEGRDNLWATATDVLQATAGIESTESDPSDMTVVGDILRSKKSVLHTVEPSAAAVDVLNQMAAHEIGALAVTENEIRLVGIISERDILRALSGQGIEILDGPVGELMTVDVATCGLEDSIDTLMALMTHRRIRHLPVVEDGRLIAMVSIGDVVRRILEERGESAAA